ncbi:MAG: hypothetical protein RR063_12110 [Anaerovoracaceae bacterium]
MLISNETNEALDILYSQYFNLNSLCDNAVSFMLNNWAMVQANDIIHHKLCHWYPLGADEISSIKDNYDLKSIRLEVPEHSEEYSNLAELFDRIYNEHETTYKMIKMVNKVAIDNGDLNVQYELVKVIKHFNIIIGQIITLMNKAHQMPNDFDTFDRHISSWGINGLDNCKECD